MKLYSNKVINVNLDFVDQDSVIIYGSPVSHLHHTLICIQFIRMSNHITPPESIASKKII